MAINISNTISLSEASRNFSKAIDLAEDMGSIVILKRNKPRYMLIDLDKSPVIEMTDDEKIDFVARRVLDRFKPAFEELAR